MKIFKYLFLLFTCLLLNCGTTNTTGENNNINYLDTLKVNMIGKEYFYVPAKVFIYNIDLNSKFILKEINHDVIENAYKFIFENNQRQKIIYSANINRNGEADIRIFRNKHDSNYIKYTFRGSLERNMNLGEQGFIGRGFYDLENIKSWYNQLVDDKSLLINQIEKRNRLISVYNVSDFIYFNDYIDSAINIYRNSMVGFSGVDLNYIENNIILALRPNDMNIYPYGNNRYVFEKEYNTWYQGQRISSILQFIVNDNLGLIINENGRLTHRYEILIKSSGSGNITLRNGNVVSRKLFDIVTPFENTPEIRNEFSFRIENGNVIITKYEGSSKHVNIPERINGLPVTEIGRGAFYAKRIESVIIPRYVTTIGEQAFDMNELSSIILPPNIKEIGRGAFLGNRIQRLVIPNSMTNIGGFGNSRLTEIIIPNSIIRIDDGAFYGNLLKNINIPNSVNEIGDKAFSDNPLISVFIPSNITTINGNPFSGCKTLPEIIIDENNINYRSIDGIVFSKDGKSIIAYPAGKGNRYTIPSTITRIERRAFDSCRLIEIIIPNSVISIGYCAFYENYLENITIPESVEFIDNSAFMGNRNLKSIIILSNNIKSLLRGTFAGNSNLSSITIPSGIELEFDDWSDCFTREFDILYSNNGRIGGRYTLENNRWVLD